MAVTQPDRSLDGGLPLLGDLALPIGRAQAGNGGGGGNGVILGSGGGNGGNGGTRTYNSLVDGIVALTGAIAAPNPCDHRFDAEVLEPPSRASASHGTPYSVGPTTTSGSHRPRRAVTIASAVLFCYQHGRDESDDTAD